MGTNTLCGTESRLWGQVFSIGSSSAVWGQTVLMGCSFPYGAELCLWG